MARPMLGSALGEMGKRSLGDTAYLVFCVLLDEDPARMRRGRTLNKESKDLGPRLVT